MAQAGNGARNSRFDALLIEQDEGYQGVIATCIRLAGGRVTAVPGVDEGLAGIADNSFDIVVWGVPDQARPRTETIIRLRDKTNVPLILVDDGGEIVQADLDAGADQVLPKPFIPGALIAAIRAALRKAPRSMLQLATRIEVRGMTFDSEQRRLRFQDREASFTRQEWELLAIFVANPNRFYSAPDILRLGWKAGVHGADQVRIYVRRLRQKVQPLNLPCQLISEHGRGYCLQFD